MVSVLLPRGSCWSRTGQALCLSMVLQILSRPRALSGSPSTSQKSPLDYSKTDDVFQKFCSARSESPPGQLIYSRENYAIYEVDGEGHQVCPSADLKDAPLTVSIAIQPEPLPLRQVIPRQQVCLLRRRLLQLLPPCPQDHDRPSSRIAAADHRLLQQREDELG